MEIKVLDLLPVVQCSGHFRPSIDECPNQNNVTFVEGDFFKGPLPTADLFVLTHILHDWSDEKVDVILSNIYNGLPSGNNFYVMLDFQYIFRQGSVFPSLTDLF